MSVQAVHRPRCSASAALRFGKSLRDVFPVGDVPYSLDEVWTHVLVLQVIRMLPHIYGEQRH